MNAQEVLSVLVGASARAALVIAVVWLTGIALRRAPARTRQRLWFTAITITIALPVAMMLLPAREMAIVPTLRTEHGTAAAQPKKAAQPENGWVTQNKTASPTPLVFAVPPRPVGPAQQPETTALDESERGLGVGPESTAILLPTTVSQGSARTSFFDRIDPWQALLVLWALGVFAFLIRLARRLHAAVKIERFASETEDAGLLSLVHELRGQLGITRPVRLLIGEHVPSPMTLGARSPAILLPGNAGDWPADRTRVVLAHELVHIRHRDWTEHLLASLTCVAHWFNPLVWIAAQKLSRARESACDAGVLALGTRPSTYAKHLLTLTRELGERRPPVPALAMAHRPILEERLMAILNQPSPTRYAIAIGTAMPLMIVLAGTAVAAVRITSAQTTPPAHAEIMTSLVGSVEPGHDLIPAALARILDELSSLEAQRLSHHASLSDQMASRAAAEIELQEHRARVEPIAMDMDLQQRRLHTQNQRIDTLRMEQNLLSQKRDLVNAESDVSHAQMQAYQVQMEKEPDRVELLQEKMSTCEQRLSLYQTQTQALTMLWDANEAQMVASMHEMDLLHRQLLATEERLNQTQESQVPVRDGIDASGGRLNELTRLVAVIDAQIAEKHAEVERQLHRLLRKDMRTALRKMELQSVDVDELLYGLSQTVSATQSWKWNVKNGVLTAQTPAGTLAESMLEAVLREHQAAFMTPEQPLEKRIDEAAKELSTLTLSTHGAQ